MYNTSTPTIVAGTPNERWSLRPIVRTHRRGHWFSLLYGNVAITCYNTRAKKN